ncbi:MAG: FAD-dependent thymidylate synthase [Candidatus Omnitrophica bacterium]|nr:FAD-dependent thymidylate synthase [Candidatus Omnitrophota bacterium]MBU1127613.1 FAD-dependent thymidylate synthase [Candidatus Omnitrophota bacterium]MBU1656840.1 FAD-dependent thymidylate synthase [Candidatus Omnitrophota bacterium]MBU1783900.1 FAD-dependent thymidylate synthase [Candidatus Omnitrophota bacterium]MBU1851438.1 FAD-dependent thymidylate synthase [Candidatus Omnitrophota bacterium]
MEVYLAGYNVDTAVLKELEEKSGKREDLTPEVLSAAYARISRDPRPINEIRESARGEVERSRRSNSTIIFKMGHHSVAEHAIFNLDIIGVSRLAMEEIEKFRLCSYTEKSQRYITLDKDFVIPEEIKGRQAEKMFVNMIHEQNKAYFALFGKLQEHVFAKHADLAADPKNHNLLEGWAKEDARYITALATESQVGQTINARNMELLLRRFASHPLAEVRALGCALYEKISDVAPSIVLFHEANDRDLKTYPELRELAGGILGTAAADISQSSSPEVQLVGSTENGDNIIAASLLHVSSDISYEHCLSVVQNMPGEKKMEIFKAAWRNMQFYDSMPREFEYVNLTFDVVLSAACFGQLKRHRMSTITAQPYDPRLGVTIPEAVKEVGMEAYFWGITDKTAEVYDAIRREIPQAAPYILTNAHRKRVLIRLNAREMYHISRLREDAHSQWDIRNIARAMSRAARQTMPLVFAATGGKDQYNEIYKNVFGRTPKVGEAVLPGERKIKG